MRRYLALASISLLAIAEAGCGPSGTPPSTAPDAQRRVALSDVGELVRTYQVAKKQAPKSEKDLERYEMGSPTGMASINKKEIVVFWGATLPDLGEEPGKVASDQVLAYEKDVPKAGGLVLMLDRTVKAMTAEEFKSAPKAGKN